MNDIYDPTNDFNFENLSMTSPVAITGGTHFSKFLMNKNPLYIQTPKCSTKMGIVKTGKKIHMDLVFTNMNEEFIQWIETLETTTRKLIYANREKWFDTELDEDDIESYFTPTVKLFKSGKQYLVRVIANQRINGTPAVKIYDESEADVAPESLDDKTSMITIIEVHGVRCSAKSFQIELVLKQAMVIKPVEIFEKCIIKERSVVKPNLENTKPVIQNQTFNNSLAASEDNIQMEISENTFLETDKDKYADNVEYDTTNNVEYDVVKEQVVDTATVSTSNDNQTPELSSNNIIIENNENTDIQQNSYELEPLEIDLDDTNIKAEDAIFLKDKTEVYYEMYRNARKKAKLAKSLALSSFMEARRIKNMYMLDDLEDSDDDQMDLENLENEDFDEDE